MSILQERSRKVEQEQNAQANKPAVPKAILTPKGCFESRAEESGFIPVKKTDKSHCFCPLLARFHGEESATIFQGLGYKIATSKKLHAGRKWHYDTLETLEKRWPYLSDSGIHGILTRHAEEGRVIKGAFNKASFDRTTWYSMAPDLLNRATDDHGKLWFDVDVAIACHSIVAGTLYQNLRYHLLVTLADDPGFTGVPYYKVNKAHLARILPWSLSTIKRGFDDLVEYRFVAERGTCNYTICVEADLVVPEGMQAQADRRIASKSSSSAEMGSSSSTEMTGSSTEQSVSSTEESVSTTENYTHCKPFQRHVYKHHSLPAPPPVCGERASVPDENKIHQPGDTLNEQGSSPVPGKEKSSPGVACVTIPHDLVLLRREITDLTSALSSVEEGAVDEVVNEFAMSFAFDGISSSILAICCFSNEPSVIMASVGPEIFKEVDEHDQASDWNGPTMRVCALRILEILTGALLLYGSSHPKHHLLLKHCHEEVEAAYRLLPDLASREDAPFKAKAALFIEQVSSNNKEAWPTYSHGEVKYTVSTQNMEKDAALFFESHPELSVDNAWNVLADCVEVKKLNTAPNGFDPLFYPRRGVSLKFLFKHWETIKAQLDAADVLAS